MMFFHECFEIFGMSKFDECTKLNTGRRVSTCLQDANNACHFAMYLFYNII